jgi:hypothetical protein
VYLGQQCNFRGDGLVPVLKGPEDRIEAEPFQKAHVRSHFGISPEAKTIHSQRRCGCGSSNDRTLVPIGGEASV